MATQVVAEGSRLEAWAVDHQDTGQNWSNHIFISTQQIEVSGFWVMRERLMLDCLFIISFEDMFNANDNDKKIKVYVTQVWHFVTLEENYFNNFSIKWHLWHHMYNVINITFRIDVHRKSVHILHIKISDPCVALEFVLYIALDGHLSVWGGGSGV